MNAIKLNRTKDHEHLECRKVIAGRFTDRKLELICYETFIAGVIS